MFTTEIFVHLSSCCIWFSSDIVWEIKPKKKGRWKTLNTEEVEMIENRFKEYCDSSPIDNCIANMENNFQVREQGLLVNLEEIKLFNQTF